MCSPRVSASKFELAGGMVAYYYFRLVRYQLLHSDWYDEAAPHISELTSRVESHKRHEDSSDPFSDVDDNDDEELGTEELLVDEEDWQTMFATLLRP